MFCSHNVYMRSALFAQQTVIFRYSANVTGLNNGSKVLFSVR